jgi:hypothetical protein
VCGATSVVSVLWMEVCKSCEKCARRERDAKEKKDIEVLCGCSLVQISAGT